MCHIDLAKELLSLEQLSDRYAIKINNSFLKAIVYQVRSVESTSLKSKMYGICVIHLLMIVIKLLIIQHLMVMISFCRIVVLVKKYQ